MRTKNKLPHLIEMRIDEQKFRELQHLLASSRYRSMSELLRDILYDKKIVTVTYDASLDKVMEKISAVRTELRAIGVNINQVTHYFNSTPDPVQKLYHARSVVALFTKVGMKIDELLPIVQKLAERWLQK